MSLSSLAYLDRLLGDVEIGKQLDADADIAAMLAFEVALAEAGADVGFISTPAVDAIRAAVSSFKVGMEALAASTLKDGVPVPGLVDQLRRYVDGEHAKAVHFGATSQDVVDTALAMKAASVLDILAGRLEAVERELGSLILRFGEKPLMARTRMQAAIPISVADRVGNWRTSVRQLAGELPVVREGIAVVSLGGAAGTAEKYGDRIEPVRRKLADRLSLHVPDYVPHTDRRRIADLANFLSKVTGSLGKIGQDAALMVQNGIGQISIGGGGGSSAMPHKQNPVRAEVLVALARFNAVQVSAIHHALVHEQERSGSAWTLEWLVMPQMMEAAGVALNHAISMLSSVESIGDP
ncbi:3-carboxy-cis,cis-muconate cycloisomerase [Ciceribacter sp. L1K23]|uniref:3-carboxy-cis,cis-muconate cycloisomerase n=1 Tax=Ciceribacter sp. L1K23 TaxID=2820276 RepID=UPI001B81967A|nr:3-carboxy-cis,cis-muconate cycloisomerase [Ciceribacter sp. L1K23]MBR0557567.1 3-carboxy-cis,cis-muconate cycloisomerase [Ciceribacter sp. L1K23]